MDGCYGWSNSITGDPETEACADTPVLARGKVRLLGRRGEREERGEELMVRGEGGAVGKER